MNNFLVTAFVEGGSHITENVSAINEYEAARICKHAIMFVKPDANVAILSVNKLEVDTDNE
tara:strand:+ start:102 stop:284 length:183 start_codon:yes stop_codon:yes gene_type:complete